MPFCNCIPDPVRLLARGFIAVSPDTFKTAISIFLVQFFEIIWESVPMSVSGFAEGLWRWHTLRGEPHISQITHRVRAVLRSATQLMAPYVSLVMEGLSFDKLYSSFAIYFYRRRSSTERYYPLILLKSSRQSVQPVLGPVSKGICKPVIATTFSPSMAISVTLDLPQLPRMTSPRFGRPVFLHKSYIEYAEHEVNTTGGKGHKAVAEGDSVSSWFLSMDRR